LCVRKRLLVAHGYGNRHGLRFVDVPSATGGSHCLAVTRAQPWPDEGSKIFIRSGTGDSNRLADTLARPRRYQESKILIRSELLTTPAFSFLDEEVFIDEPLAESPLDLDCRGDDFARDFHCWKSASARVAGGRRSRSFPYAQRTAAKAENVFFERSLRAASRRLAACKYETG
jgi:hypothetical protein